MPKKNTSKYTASELINLKNDKPVVYDIINKSGKVNFTGSARRGKVIDRIREQLNKVPGVKVKIKQYHSIEEAKKAAARKIAIKKPRYNEKENKGKLTTKKVVAKKTDPKKTVQKKKVVSKKVVVRKATPKKAVAKKAAPKKAVAKKAARKGSGGTGANQKE